MNVDRDIRNIHGISSDASCSLPHLVTRLRAPFDDEKDEDPSKLERNKLAARIAASYVPHSWKEVVQHPVYNAITQEFEPSKEIDDYFNDKVHVFCKLMYETLNSVMKRN